MKIELNSYLPDFPEDTLTLDNEDDGKGTVFIHARDSANDRETGIYLKLDALLSAVGALHKDDATSAAELKEVA